MLRASSARSQLLEHGIAHLVRRVVRAGLFGKVLQAHMRRQSAVVNPEAYLRDLITRIADYPAKRIAELLPWNVRL